MIAHLVRSADFERVLRTRSRASSPHFALHHVAGRPSPSAKAAAKREPSALPTELSTRGGLSSTQAVDDSSCAAPEVVWLGTVVPKRHARRAVTRNLLKRQIRSVVNDQAAALAAGLWVVRLRAPFDKARFVSANSDDLKRVAREELERLVISASKPAGRVS